MAAPDKSITALISELSGQLSTLLRQEVQLARAEIAAGMRAMVRDTVMLAIAAAFGLAALFCGVAMLVLVLVEWGVSAWAAAGLIALLLAITSGLLISSRLHAMRRRHVIPTEAVRTAKETAQWLKAETFGKTTTPR